MLQFKKVTSVLCAAFVLVSSLCFATSQNYPYEKLNDPIPFRKVYITTQNLVFHEGRLLIDDGNDLLFVKTLHQD